MVSFPVFRALSAASLFAAKISRRLLRCHRPMSGLSRVIVDRELIRHKMREGSVCMFQDQPDVLMVARFFGDDRTSTALKKG